MKRLGIVSGAILSLVALSLAASAAIRGGQPADPAGSAPLVPLGQAQVATPPEDDEDAHGGPIERFHGAAACDLVDTSPLPGNWTHGDYVTAVAGLGDPALVREAAHSRCGKPMVSLRKGPPAHAKAKGARAVGSAGGA
jgi:hypothetical protein